MQFKAREELGVERVFKRPDSEKLPVGAAVHLVERRARVEDVRAGLVAVRSELARAVQERRDVRDAVDDRRVDDLAAAALGPLEPLKTTQTARTNLTQL